MSEPHQSVRVEAYAGASYPEKPTAVWYEGRRHPVVSLLRSRRSPSALHFLVEVEDLGRLELVYELASDTWFSTSPLPSVESGPAS